MSLAAGGAWLVLAALWQAAALPAPALLGAHADIAVVIVLVWAYVRSPEDAAVLALIGGLTLDGLSDQPLGFSVLALLPAAVAGSVRGARILDTDWFSTVLLVVVATLAYHALLLGLLTISGEQLPVGTLYLEEALPAAVLNGLIAPLVYLVVWAASFDVRPSRRQLRTSE